jgi:hypothetical protein
LRERSKKSRIPKSLLLLNFSPNLREAIINMITAKEVWDALKTRYHSSTEDRKAMLLQQQVSAKQKSGDKVTEFRSRVEGYVPEVKEGCNEAVSDAIIIGILMQGVLPAFQDTVTALRCLDNLKVVNIKRKLVAFEQLASMASSHGGSGDHCGDNSGETTLPLILANRTLFLLLLLVLLLFFCAYRVCGRFLFPSRICYMFPMLDLVCTSSVFMLCTYMTMVLI